jgi:hypothetical protein
MFFAQILATLPVYFACILLVFQKEAKEQFRKWQHSRFARAIA